MADNAEAKILTSPAPEGNLNNLNHVHAEIMSSNTLGSNKSSPERANIANAQLINAGLLNHFELSYTGHGSPAENAIKNIHSFSPFSGTIDGAHHLDNQRNAAPGQLKEKEGNGNPGERGRGGIGEGFGSDSPGNYELSSAGSSRHASSDASSSGENARRGESARRAEREKIISGIPGILDPNHDFVTEKSPLTPARH